MSDDKAIGNHEHFTSIGEAVGYDDATREFFILAQELGDGVIVRQLISYCPICGEELPTSLREEWFAELEQLGIDPLNDPIPEPYKDGSWWRQQVRGQY